MSKRRNQHVVKHDKGWAVKGAGNERTSNITNTQQKAIHIAKERAKQQGSELFIHGKDGKIRERNSYGNDPFPPRG